MSATGSALVWGQRQMPGGGRKTGGGLFAIGIGVGDLGGVGVGDLGGVGGRVVGGVGDGVVGGRRARFHDVDGDGVGDGVGDVGDGVVGNGVGGFR